MRHSPFSHGFAAPLVLFSTIVLLGASLAGLLSIPDASSSVVAQGDLVALPAKAVIGDVLAPGVLVVSLSASATAVAPEWHGAVTAVKIAIGDVVTEGAVVLSVNGIGRVLSGGDLPFWRNLAKGDSGSDVDALRQFLNRVGFKVAARPNGRPVDADLERAIGQFATHIGVPEGARTVVFDATWTIYLPRSGTVQKFGASVGEQAPSAGSDLLTLSESVTGATISTGLQGIVPAKVIMPGGEELQISNGSVDAAGTAIILPYLLGSEVVGGSTSETEEGTDTESLPEARTIKLDVTASYPSPAGTVVLPASSIVARLDGTMCVVEVKASKKLVPHVVNVIWSQVDESAVYVVGVDQGLNIVGVPIAPAVRRACEAG